MEQADREALLPPSVLQEEDRKPKVASQSARPPPVRAAPEKKPNIANYRVSNQSARRKDDDSDKRSQMLGVTRLLRNPRIRLYVATAIGALPFLLSFTFYVSSFSRFGQFVIGILCGLCIQVVYYFYGLHRTYQRKSKAVQIAQMATLNADDIRVVLPTGESFPRWIEFTDFEKMDWLNKTMTKFWPYVDQAAGDLIKEKVQPILDNYAMGVIERIVLLTVAFGNKAPQVTGVRVTPGLEDECVLEIQVVWQTENEGVIVSIHSPGPNYKVQVRNTFCRKCFTVHSIETRRFMMAVEKYILQRDRPVKWLYKEIRCALKKVNLQGTAKLVFKPLTGTIPGFGAVLVSLTEPPDFDFDIKFLGGDIGLLPGVEKMIDNSIRTALMDAVVWPSRIVVPMIPGGDFSFLELHPVGVLDVTLIEAKNVKNTDLMGKTDPFVVLYVRQTKDKIKRCSTKKNTLTPVWNENFKIEVEDPEYQKLTLRLMDDESIEKSEYIGSAELAIKEFKPGMRMEMWCDVLEDPESHATDQIRGSLHIVVTYHPYSREEIIQKRGQNETEQKINEEQQILGAAEKKQTLSASDAPVQAGNITQNPSEQPRAPGPAADLPSS